MSILNTLKAYVPPFVRDDPMMAAYYDAVAPELETLITLGVSVPEQAWPHLVTWGMGRLEQIYGIPADPNATTESRRSALLSKLRGTGTSTKAHIENIAASYSNGLILVTEIYGEYKIEIEFIDDLGVPVYLDALKGALRAAVPAHLLLTYILNWTTWGELATAGVTWGELLTGTVTFEELKTYEIGV